MTQKIQLLEALKFAQRMKMTGESLKREAKDYDCTWPNSYVHTILEESERLINILLGKVK